MIVLVNGVWRSSSERISTDCSNYGSTVSTVRRECDTSGSDWTTQTESAQRLSNNDTDTINQLSQWFWLVSVCFFSSREGGKQHRFFECMSDTTAINHQNAGFDCLSMWPSVCLSYRTCFSGDTADMHSCSPVCVRYTCFLLCNHVYLHASQMELNAILLAYLNCLYLHTHTHKRVYMSILAYSGLIDIWLTNISHLTVTSEAAYSKSKSIWTKAGMDIFQMCLSKC